MMRLITALATVLALFAGTMQIAYARGQAPAAGQIVVCTGQGAVTVALDADGNPTGKLIYCPECAAVAYAAIAVLPVSVPKVSATVSETLNIPQPTAPDGMDRIAQKARGPPLFV